MSDTDTDDVVTGLMNRFLMSDRFKVSRLKSSRQSGQELTPEETDNMLTDPDIDPTSLVWAVMSDLRGRTVNEVFAVVEKRQGLERKKVETILNSLVNSGEMIKAVITNTVIYTLKGSKMQQATTSRVPSGNNNNVQQDSTKYSKNEWDIDPLDSIDLAIWKLMSDGKSRILDEMSETLGELGFNKSTVRARFMQILHKNHYEARGSGTKKNYTLRKGVKAPGDIKSSKLATNVVEEHVDVAPSVKVELPSGKEVTVRQSPDFNAILASALGKPATKALQMSDSLDQCIWKVTSDREWYTVKDVDLLLEAHDFRQGMIGTRMGFLFREPDFKWFDREPMGGTRAFRYRMRENISYPADLKIDQDEMLNDMTETELPPIGEKILTIFRDNPAKNFDVTSMLHQLESVGYEVVSGTVIRIFNDLREKDIIGYDAKKDYWYFPEDGSVHVDVDAVEIGNTDAVEAVPGIKVVEAAPAPMRPIITAPKTPQLTPEQSKAIEMVRESIAKSPDEHVPTKGKTMTEALAVHQRQEASAKVDAVISKAKAPADEDDLLIEQVTMIKGVPFSSKELKALVDHLGATLRAIGDGDEEVQTSHGGLTFTTRVVSDVSFTVKGIGLNRNQAIQIVNSFGNL